MPLRWPSSWRTDAPLVFVALLVATLAFEHGLTDAEIAEMTRWFEAHTIARFGRYRQVEPTVVVEVAFDVILRRQLEVMRRIGMIDRPKGRGDGMLSEAELRAFVAGGEG